MSVDCWNPIYTEYYAHVNAECFKINLPWSKYNKHKVVLCPVSEGMDKARKIAKRVILSHMKKALHEGI